MSRTVCQLDGEGFRVTVTEHDDGSVTFTSDADIDADGAPHAYHPDNHKGLDDIRNAKDSSGHFVGVLTDKYGAPLVQQEGDPAPGYYISTTAYQHSGKPPFTQRRYLDSENIAYMVVSPLIRKGVKGIVLGCKARIEYMGDTIEAIVGDIGPTRKAGEISIAAARLLGIPSSPRNGGEDRPIVKYTLWPGIQGEIAGHKFELQPA